MQVMKPSLPLTILFPDHSAGVRVLCQAIVVLICIAGLSPSLFAQIDRAVLEGTVTDSSGRVISGATVKAVSGSTGISQVRQSNAEGYYRFPGLAVGDYSVTVN